jgi:hypothetical protein
MKLENNTALLGGQLMTIIGKAVFQTHIWHLQTNTQGHHVALGTFYSDLQDFQDEIIEVYQGLHGVRIDGKFNIDAEGGPEEKKSIPFLKNFIEEMEIIREHKHMESGALQNIYDEIVALTSKTIYLLTLKG